MAMSARHAIVPESMARNRNDLCQRSITLWAEIRSMLRNSVTGDSLCEPMIAAVSLLSWQCCSAQGTNGYPISKGKKPTKLPRRTCDIKSC